LELLVQPRFCSFIQAGFECSTHYSKHGRRLDLITSTRHDELVKQDYRRLLQAGIRTVREGLRWHLIERARHSYDFSSIVPLLDAAEGLEVEQILDLFHFGWPDHLDIFSSEFVDASAEFAANFAYLLGRRGLTKPYIAPVNEISFVSWAGGDVAILNPFQKGRGHELKRQLARAGIKAAAALKSELPDCFLIWPEPVIHIVGDPDKPGDQHEAEAYRLSMYQAWDMLSGRMCPELGGSLGLLQMIGVNFYDRNEWINYGRPLRPSDPLYKPFHAILQEVWERYHVPMFVSETGAEDEKRPEWFSYISAEVRTAVKLGVPVEGICLYPILNHPGWEDDRHCCNGLFDYPDAHGERAIYQPLAVEISKQQKLNFECLLKGRGCGNNELINQ
jgi:hypothetical protein